VPRALARGYLPSVTPAEAGVSIKIPTFAGMTKAE